MMWLNKFTKENIEDDNKKKEHAHRQTESCSNSNAYGSQHGVRTRECRLERAMC